MRQKDAFLPEDVLYSGITAQAVRLYCVLRRYADKDTWEAYPSRKTLAKRLNASDPKVADRATQELVALARIHRLSFDDHPVWVVLRLVGEGVPRSPAGRVCPRSPVRSWWTGGWVRLAAAGCSRW